MSECDRVLVFEILLAFPDLLIILVLIKVTVKALANSINHTDDA